MKPAFKWQWTSLISLAEKRLLAMTLAAVLCWRVAGWTVYFLAPPSRPIPADLRGDVDVGVLARVPWFGVEPALPAGGPAVATDLKIIGLYAGGARPSALIAASSQPAAAYREGDEIIAGIKLLKVESDHVLIDRSGVTERINFQIPMASMVLEQLDSSTDAETTLNKPNPRQEIQKK